MRLESVGVKFGFFLLKDNGDVLIPTDRQTERLFEIPEVQEVGSECAQPYKVIFYVEAERYTPDLVAELQRKVRRVFERRRSRIADGGSHP